MDTDIKKRFKKIFDQCHCVKVEFVIQEESILTPVQAIELRPGYFVE